MGLYNRRRAKAKQKQSKTVVHDDQQSGHVEADSPHFLSIAPGIFKSAKFGIVRKLCQAGVGLSGLSCLLLPNRPNGPIAAVCFSSLAPWLTYCCCSCSLFCCFCGRDSSNQHILTASTWLWQDPHGRARPYAPAPTHLNGSAFLPIPDPFKILMGPPKGLR